MKGFARKKFQLTEEKENPCRFDLCGWGGGRFPSDSIHDCRFNLNLRDNGLGWSFVSLG